MIVSTKGPLRQGVFSLVPDAYPKKTKSEWAPFGFDGPKVQIPRTVSATAFYSLKTVTLSSFKRIKLQMIKL